MELIRLGWRCGFTGSRGARDALTKVLEGLDRLGVRAPAVLPASGRLSSAMDCSRRLGPDPGSDLIGDQSCRQNSSLLWLVCRVSRCASHTAIDSVA
jgi:hypothetical protein